MLKQLIAVWLVVAAAIAITAAVIPSVEIDGGVLGLLWVALLFGLVNAVIGPVLRFISIPLNVITFGLFALVVNAALLGITAGLTDYLDVGGFFSAVLAAIVISAVTAVLVFAVDRLLTTREPEPA
ncbi:phage holin family protein [Nocardioides bizhenqiangii]|uniref:Phage holin family protein n=1 Tax=Nocardioides bizhenqiangii TaxID=3095076 RepID=A0ABZ0ZVC7_9ACTN|nr:MULTISPECIES: phage holin family protein [unclassified Nocardioides]MDZ5623056.1 phage holin family protein [Nocardioides sp. HM23]WQQ28035.1 phage holin family protein [Nocardioides sp. HM61]